MALNKDIEVHASREESIDIGGETVSYREHD